MAFKCPNCGGQAYYNVSKGMLKCESCGELIPVKDISGGIELGKNDTAQEQSDTMGVNSFVCRNCGAEILSPDESIVGYCSYCGSEAMLEGRMTEEVRPRYIMPFSKSKTQCKNAYLKHTDKMLYLPKELKDPEYLEKFRGTYIPYWMYEVDFPEETRVQGTYIEKHHGTITESTYDVTAKIEGSYEGIPYDASSCFDDTISDMLMPFDKKNLQEFNPAYLAGFYADRADVPSDRYQDDVKKKAAANGYSAITSSIHQSEAINLTPLSEEQSRDLLNPSIVGTHTTLFPVWFLTWRKKDRVAYAIVNGQTGKLSCDLPVDMKTFGLTTVGIAALIFVLLTLLVSMTAITALKICTLLTIVVMFLFNREVKKIRNRENHIGNRGYFTKGADVKMPEAKREKLKAKAEKKKGRKFLDVQITKPRDVAKVILFTLVGIIGLSIVMTMISIAVEEGESLRVVMFDFLIIGMVLFISSSRALRYVTEKSMWLFNLLGFLSVVCGFVIAAIKPVNDIYYYFACTGCGVATALAAVGLIRYYNLLTTRPVPTFFDREGGQDSAKE